MTHDPQKARKERNAQIKAVEAEIRDERLHGATFETDIGKAIEELPSPFIVDAGPYTSRRDREAIQAEQDRWTRLERMGR